MLQKKTLWENWTKYNKDGVNKMKKITMLILFSISYAFASELSKETVKDSAHHLQWQDTQAIQDYSDIWKKSKAHCEGLALAGHDDWRLPTKKELVILAKSQELKKRFSYMKKEVFWTSEIDANDDINALTVFSGNGFVSSNDRCDESYAMCVRDNY